MTHAPSEAAMGAAAAGNGQDASFWRSHTQISLQPVAAPSILGLYGFAAATFMVSANLAGWYGTSLSRAATTLAIFPFAMIAGGVAQFLAGMWSYRARDGLASAMHGIWGSFWIAYGIYFVLVAARVLPPPSVRSAQLGLGWWFIVLAAITWMGALAAVAKNMALTAVLLTLAAGSTILAIGWVWPLGSLIEPAGNILVASAVFAFYTASALMLEGAFNRTILPVFQLFRHGPRQMHLQPIQYELGEPGVKAGQ